MRIAELARRAGVSRETIHFYLREGLLPRPRKTGRNMAYYDEGRVEHIQAIKRLQNEKYLPLSVIKKVLRGARAPGRPEDVELVAELFTLGEQPARPVPAKELGRRTGAINRHHGIGWECLHVCIDDACRLAYSEVLPDERKETATVFLERALAWFAGHGVAVERVMTDNGNCYRSQVFGQACANHGLRHLRTRPYTPRTNGKAERFIQTSLREWAYAQPYVSSQQRCAALTAWLDRYNSARPHTALGGCPPAARLRQHQLLCSTQGTVASSRPASTDDHSVGPGQGSPKATGDSRRPASLRRPVAVVTLAQGGTLARSPKQPS